MLYRVKLTSVLVDAASRREAFLVARRKLNESPDSFIAGVYNDETVSGHRPLWRRIVTGK